MKQSRWGQTEKNGTLVGDEQLSSLRTQLEAAQAGERAARGLLQAMASVMGSDDAEVVLTALAENAVRYLGIQRVAVYRADHEKKVLVRVALARAEGEENAPLLPESVQIRVIETIPDPVPLGSSHLLAEFARGDDTWHLTTVTDASGQELSCALVKMRCGEGGNSRPGALLGVIAACNPQPFSARQLELLRALAPLGAAAAEVAHLEQMRAQLISSVSHELRTPLAAIRAYNELLLDEDAGEINEEQRLFLERIETICLQLERMIDDILDLSRLRSGEMVIQKRPTDVRAVIQHIIDTLSPEAKRDNITLRLEIEEELPSLQSSPDHLAQVLFNLVGNGVKYVGAGGEVIVRAGIRDREECLQRAERRAREARALAKVPRYLVIEVSDNGPGIAPDDLNRVFDEFFRGHTAEGGTKGAGLGLAIAAQLTHLLGGIIDVESKLGEGSTFVLIFPLLDNENASA